MAPTGSKKSRLQALIARRHPDYATMLNHWNFLEATYKGGREWFTSENLFKYLKEGDVEYKDRLRRAYRFNHTRETVDLVNKYIFKAPIARNEADAPDELQAFWNKATLSNLDIRQYMGLLSRMSSVFGRIWVFVDSNKATSVLSRKDEKSSGAAVYSYFVKPQDALDFAFDENGELAWMLVRESARDDESPFDCSGLVTERYRLWTKEAWYLYEIRNASNPQKLHVVEIDSRPNTLKRIPCFPVDHVIGDNRYVAPALIDDIAYLDRAVANYLSNIDAIIQDQTFSQLAMPIQSAMVPGYGSVSDESDEDGERKKFDARFLEMGTKRIFVYDGEGGGKPMFLSPDPKQAGVIVTVINKIIAEIYHTIGMAGERTKQDNAVGIDNSSGVAKAYDFERMNSLLAAKAGSLENAENKLTELVLAYHQREAPSVELVKYPLNFDVRSLYDDFAIAEKLLKIDAPVIVRRHQMEQLMDKLFPACGETQRSELMADLKDWVNKLHTNVPNEDVPRNAGQENRQGEVTSDSSANPRTVT